LNTAHLQQRQQQRQQARGFSSSAWEQHWWASRSRVEQHNDVAAARAMLPNRAHVVPQFTAHGFQLIPESLVSPFAALQPFGGDGGSSGAAAAATAAAEGTTAPFEGLEAAAADAPLAAAGAAAAAVDLSGQQQPAMYAESVKRKRRLKMKRHKYRKRMRAMKAGGSK
jgi:hypothetical protein